MSQTPESREQAIARLQKSASELETRATPPPPDYGGTAVGYGYRLLAELLGGVLVGLGLGWGFDSFVGTMPWGIIVGTVAGFGVSVWLAVHTAKKLSARALQEFGPAQDLPDDADEEDER